MPSTPVFPDGSLAFDPASYWQPGEYDAAQLVAALKAQPDLADFEDEQGPQSRVRLDEDADPANVGYWITVPSTTAQSVVDAGVAAYQSPPPPPPPDPLVSSSVAANAAVAAAMAAVSITSPNLTGAQKTQIQTQVRAAVQAAIQTGP